MTNDKISEKTAVFEKKRVEILKKLSTQEKRLKSRLISCQATLQECLSFKLVQHEAELLQTNFPKLKRGMQQIALPDWEQDLEPVIITLNPKLLPKEEVQKRFKKAKKLRIGIDHQQKRLLILENELIETAKKIEQAHLAKSMEELFLIFPEKKPAEKKIEAKTLPYREYESKTGFKILVGKNSSCNDALTFQVAKGSDLWLHVKDYPGSHVIIRTKRGIEVDEETLSQAVQLACHYSKAKNVTHAEVCLTEQKYVSRFGKQRNGKVQISKQKIIQATVIPHHRGSDSQGLGQSQ